MTELLSFIELPVEPFPLGFATGLFSFLYHLAYYEVGKLEIISVCNFILNIQWNLP